MTPNDTAYNVFIRPFTERYHIILTTTVLCFVIQHICGWVAKFLFPKAWAHMEKNKTTDEWCVRTISTLHSLLAWSLIPGYFFPAAGTVTDDFYSFEPLTYLVCSLSTGYFIWDMVICIKHQWGIAFLCHALCSWSVVYFALYPFLNYQGRFFLGLFEISTVMLNTYKQLELCGLEGGTVHKIVGMLFALSFTVCRIILGIPCSISWALQMYELMASGKAHSNIVVAVYLVANGSLNVLNVVWFQAILAQAMPSKKAAKIQD